MTKQPVGPWEKADVILKPVGGLLAALSVALVGLIGSRFLERQQMRETNARLYAQLMSGREESDSLLRQEMFKTIISDFLAPTPGGRQDGMSLEQEVLKLEILAYNFHEALDLGPLFKHVYRRVTDPPEAEAGNGGRADFLSRLERVAKEITGKQIATLEDSGVTRQASIDLETFEEEGWLPKVIHEELTAADAELASAAFSVDVLEVDKDKREVRVRLSVWPSGWETPLTPVFSVGFFDFPMIDNTRLPNGARCAIVLTDFAEFGAELTLLYFPGSRASLKEKPFYDEIIRDLVRRGGPA